MTIIDPTPAPRPERITLHGRYARIVPLDPASHGNALFARTCGPAHDALWTYLFDGPYADRATFDRDLRAKAESPDPFHYAIVDTVSDEAVGTAALMRIEPVHRVIEVGHVIFSPALQRTRGATEAMYLLARYVFETLGYRRYEWKCHGLNAPSRRAARRLGFTFEGVFRQHMIMKGRNRDTAWFSMLDGEWPERKARFEAWLDPANFDADGRQKTPLSPDPA